MKLDDRQLGQTPARWRKHPDCAIPATGTIPAES
jgi:hypothetical protein